MFLTGLKSKFKYKSGLKYLKGELKDFPPVVARKSGIHAVGIIVDLDRFLREEQFYDLVDLLGLKPNAIKIIGYREYYDKNSPYATPVFSDKDLGWKGAIENSYAMEFLSREYDLLINYFDQQGLLLQLMSVKTRAEMRIGFSGLDPVYNDLILESPMEDYPTFKKELKKYLSLFNQLA